MKNSNYEIVGHSYVVNKLYYCIKIGSSVCVMQAVEYERIVLTEQEYINRKKDKKRRAA